MTPEEAVAKIEEQRKEVTGKPQNLEEQAISLVGRDIYEKLIKGYTEKQWGRDCKELPSFIIRRLPVRLTFDNNYFNALFQGIPVGGYTKMIANLLDGIEVRLNTDYLENKSELDALADKVVYTGPIDAYFDYKLGTLEYPTGMVLLITIMASGLYSMTSLITASTALVSKSSSCYRNL